MSLVSDQRLMLFYFRITLLIVSGTWITLRSVLNIIYHLKYHLTIEPMHQTYQPLPHFTFHNIIFILLFEPNAVNWSYVLLQSGRIAGLSLMVY